MSKIKIRRRMFSLVLFVVIFMSGTISAFAADNNVEETDVSITFSTGATAPINVYDAQTGRKDHEMTPADGALQVMVYAYPIAFGTVIKPSGTGAVSYWAKRGIVGVQATDLRNSGTGEWSITASLSRFKKEGVNAFDDGASIELLNGNMLKGPARDLVPGTDSHAELYDLDASTTITMGSSAGSTNVKLNAGAAPAKIASSDESTANQSAYVLRWDNTPNQGGQGNIKINIANRTQIAEGAYAAKILWTFHNTP